MALQRYRLIAILLQFKAGHLFVEEQQRNVEEAWQEQNVKILQEIASLQGDEFNTSYGGRYNNSYGVSMMSVYGGNAKLLWDFFPPIYPCPIVWQVGRLPDTGDGGRELSQHLPKRQPRNNLKSSSS